MHESYKTDERDSVVEFPVGDAVPPDRPFH